MISFSSLECGRFRAEFQFGLLLANSTHAALTWACSHHGPGWNHCANGQEHNGIAVSTSGQLQALYIMGAAPLAHYPDVSLVQRALSMVPFIVVQDILRSDWMQCAHVILPGLTRGRADLRIPRMDSVLQAVC